MNKNVKNWVQGHIFQDYILQTLSINKQSNIFSSLGNHIITILCGFSERYQGKWVEFCPELHCYRYCPGLSNQMINEGCSGNQFYLKLTLPTNLFVKIAENRMMALLLANHVSNATLGRLLMLGLHPYRIYCPSLFYTTSEIFTDGDWYNFLLQSWYIYWFTVNMIISMPQHGSVGDSEYSYRNSDHAKSTATQWSLLFPNIPQR